MTLALEETGLRAAHAVRRARWLVRLSECSLGWAEPDDPERLRVLVIDGGAVAERAELAPAHRCRYHPATRAPRPRGARPSTSLASTACAC